MQEIELAKEIDTMWVVVATCLVFFMQSGFALVETGYHSEKNVTNVFMKNVMDFVIAALAFWAIGFALMFGDGNLFIGLDGWFLANEKAFSSLDWAGVPLSIKFIFQLVFAGTAATIISGAIGGRVKFIGYLILSIVVTAFIYPILGKWVWGGGWASQLGFFDFAGSTVVHGVGGFAALAATMVVGARKGRFTPEGPQPLGSYNITFAGLGTLVLWFGWFGFNAGSTMGLVGNSELVGQILLTTNIAASGGAITAMILGHLYYKKYDLPITMNGALAGLVGITAACAFVSVIGALAIGIIAGAIMLYVTILLEKLEIDDVVGAFPVHGACGVWGTTAVGLFATQPWIGESGPALGLLYGGSFKTFFMQLTVSLGICVVSFLTTYATCKVIKHQMGLRVSQEEEDLGLDLCEHPNENFHGKLTFES